MSRTEDMIKPSSGDLGTELWHVVLTQFSYRGYNLLHRKVDPLDPRRLNFRFEIFELACAPSVIAQTNQNFDWVIIVDKDLSTIYRERILQAVGHRVRTHLHEFSPTEDVSGSAWLTKYGPAGVHRFLTTLLDDDDTLPVNFVDTIQSEVKARAGRLPYLMTFGYKSSLEWDLISSSGAPFGYKSSWHRGDWVRSAGFSLLSHQEHDVSVFSLPHFMGDLWFNSEKAEAFSLRSGQSVSPEACESVEKRRARMKIEAAVSCSKKHSGELFVELSGRTGPIVMTNHYFNDVVFRLLEPKSDRTRVMGRESFPNTVVEVELLRKRSKFFKKRWRSYMSLLRQTGELRPVGVGRLGRLSLAIWGAWRFALL